MKSNIALLILGLKLATASVAARETNHVETEKIVQQRQRDLQDNNLPLNKEEKELLKRLLAENTLRYNNGDAKEHSERRNLRNTQIDPLAAAMRKSAEKKIQSDTSLSEDERRSLQNYGGYYGGYGDYGGYGGYYGDYGESGGPGSLVVTGQAGRGRVGIPEKVSMVLEAFQDNRKIADPLLLGPTASYLDPGTQYLYSNEPMFNVVYGVPPGAHRSAYMVNLRDRVAVTSGTCIRTDPKLKYIGRSYCQFEYRFLDSKGNVEASISAEGPVSKGDVSTLAITAGSGVFRRTVGTVVLEPGSLRAGSPPVFIPNEQKDLPANYLVKMFVFMDSVDLELE
mmetsp:Transcript_31630/g.74439  ORF Transcript_31630/g.74439 Transcript_31630/m.74439 type:complete len:339 (-) Transcript_31630:119-1135(-)